MSELLVASAICFIIGAMIVPGYAFLFAIAGALISIFSQRLFRKEQQ
ncbi:hypothetical protein PLANPX_2819 [Lacipirellula parvula]|uniref:Uncharacterized protein n=1 Tax=Lacipirellula parvula TaxID=2650471 RepID=A0A5K7XB28_9BACT|nr:hypothetical protein PLANPX_2819 [Lacipirellula parvula]